MEYRTYGNRKCSVTVVAMISIFLWEWALVGRIAVRTNGRSAPSYSLQMLDTSVLSRELFIDLYDVHKIRCLALR